MATTRETSECPEVTKYTDKQERKADHITHGYEERGVPEKDAERRAWATVNKDDGGGKKSGSGRGTYTGHPAAHKGGKLGGEGRSFPLEGSALRIGEEGRGYQEAEG